MTDHNILIIFFGLSMAQGKVMWIDITHAKF